MRLNARNRRIAIAVKLLAVLGLVGFGFNYLKSQARFNELAYIPQIFPHHSYREPSNAQVSLHLKELHRFRLAKATITQKSADDRNRFDVLLPFLSGEQWQYGREAALLMGESENLRYVPALQIAARQNFVGDAKDEWTDLQFEARRAEIEMALLRIQTRSLSGEDRLRTVARGLGLSLAQLEKLFDTLNHTTHFGLVRDRPGGVIIARCIDMMVGMALHGQDVVPFQTWRLQPLQRVRLEAAAMPRRQGIQHMVKLFSKSRYVGDGAESEMYNTLFALGPGVCQGIQQGLREVTENTRRNILSAHTPSSLIRRYKLLNDLTCDPLIKAAGRCGDSSHKIYLRRFLNGSMPSVDKQLRETVRGALFRIERNAKSTGSTSD